MFDEQTQKLKLEALKLLETGDYTTNPLTVKLGIRRTELIPTYRVYCRQNKII